MNQPALHFVHCPDPGQGHRTAWWQWGDPQAAHLVLCLHGLTRQGRDFDELARTLVLRSSSAVRVVCADVVGRGQSDWLADPMGYQLPQYAADMLALLGQLHQQAPIEQLDCVGTSMGGLIGMVLGGQSELPLPAPLRRLVLNDVGPRIEPAAVARIGSYVEQGSTQFESLESAAQAFWQLSSSFGPHTPAQWLELTRPMLVPAAQRSVDGLQKLPPQPDAPSTPLVLHYDPRIGLSFRSITLEQLVQIEAATWALYDAITAQTLLLRGVQSDLLSLATAQDMGQRGPRAQLIQFDGVGHAPTLVSQDQQDAVCTFLLS